MAVYGWEWIVVILIIVAIFLWGPKKLPEIARAIGQAKKEFEKAIREGTNLERTTGTPELDDPLVSTAKKLGIATEGKTKEQISQEIIEKAQGRKE